VPLWHDSEVAAIAYAVQNIMANRQKAARGGCIRPTPLQTARTSSRNRC
jgi:hypothetical protein